MLLKLGVRMEATRTKQLHPMYRPDEGSAAAALHDRIERALSVPSGQVKSIQLLRCHLLRIGKFFSV